ncbi:TonB C-terminal domain-containing protein [Sulfuricurvum sp.]|uniref:TonB C-terminal domain-containing protein n=1 Tax=Sulfuricurvum sp. TaxID=2025608 RepID=UPI002D265F84|nr:TonB C-terminal domain-containing protein [Sulfuricurvum sp.]HZF69252.1 TonB C-terminal domain-containing protein [Sulfuricurvum sp.]
MGFNHERYFFLSGLISITLFAFLLFLAGYNFIFSPKVEQFAMTKSEFISVSLAVNNTKSTEHTEPSPKVEESEPAPEPEKPAVQPEKVPEISDLFAQVKPQKTIKKPLEDNKQNEQLNKLEKELLTHKDMPNFTDKVNKVELAKPSVKMVVQGGSSGPIVNEYHAKIQALVYTNFHPPAGSAGAVARVRMNISGSGKLISYRILSYSGNSSFNNEVDWLRDRLSTIRFPEHPEGKDTVLECILTAKE